MQALSEWCLEKKKLEAKVSDISNNRASHTTKAEFLSNSLNLTNTTKLGCKSLNVAAIEPLAGLDEL